MLDAWSPNGGARGVTSGDPVPDPLTSTGTHWNGPTPEPIDLITISREYGAGGSDLARELGARLRWPVLDRSLVCQVADRLRLDVRHVEPLDEQPPSLLARLIASTLLMTPPEMPVDVDPSGMLNPDAVAEATRAAILAAAQTPPLIVVGHGAQGLFRDRQGTLHVRLEAALPRRVDRICARETCDRTAAANVARRMDDARRAYVRRHYHADPRDPHLYDLQINTGKITVQEAADLIAGIVHARPTSGVEVGTR